MKLFLTATLLLFRIIASAQNFGSIYIDFPDYYTQKDLNYELKQSIKEKSTATLSRITAGDTSIYTVHCNADSFKIKLTYTIKDDRNRDQDCDFQEETFYCKGCAARRLYETLVIYKFRQQSDNVYFSGGWWDRLEMTVQFNPSNPDLLILTYRKSTLSKKEYKKLYATLKQPDFINDYLQNYWNK